MLKTLGLVALRTNMMMKMEAMKKMMMTTMIALIHLRKTQTLMSGRTVSKAVMSVKIEYKN